MEKAYTAMIADRRHPDNGKMYAAKFPSWRFALQEPLPAEPYANASWTVIAARVEHVVLHYGTFNGVPVWTAERIDT